jgi:hypothetical protein
LRDRNFATISSGLYRFLAITVLLDVKDIPQVGPLQWGRIRDTLGPDGYNFGVQQGLSLSGTGIFDVYSIDIRFYFDDINASPNGFQRILEFKNLAADTGLYERGGALLFFVRDNQTGASSGPGLFASGEPADLLLTRSAAGLLSAYVNDTLAFTFLDPTGLATFSGPDNVIWFFMDDFESLATGFPEAGWLR